MSELFDIYIEEVKEHLEILNESLLKLEELPNDADVINEIFRVAHTIKGSSAAMGFLKLENLTHCMEDILQDIRDGNLIVDKKIIELLFICHDIIESTLDCILRTGKEEDINIDKILSNFHTLIGQKNTIVENKNTNCGKIENFNLSVDEANDVESSLGSNQKIFILTIKVEEKCVFKSIKVWFVFQEILQYSQIIKSNPNVPTIEDFQNGSFKFEENTIEVLISTNLDNDSILEKLNSITEIEKVIIKEINEVTYENDNSNNNISIDVDNYRCTFLQQIKDEVEKIKFSIIQIEEDSDVERAVNLLFRSFHTIRRIAKFIGSDLIKEISSKSMILIDKIKFKTLEMSSTIVDIIIKEVKFIEKICLDFNLQNNDEFIKEVSYSLKDIQNIIDISKIKNKRIGEILLEQGKITESNVEEVLKKQKEMYPDLKFGQVAVKENIIDVEDLVQSLRVQGERNNQKVAFSATSLPEGGFIRVATNKLDGLVDMLGELLIVYSLLEKETEEFKKETYINALIRMARLIKEIQVSTMSLRMVSLKTTFQKVLRLGRDVSNELKKIVDIKIMGEDTELERSIADKLYDPLMHLVRNAVSHGIEEKNMRLKKGKKVRGTITINAYSKKGSVYIEVQDDGGGLDIEKIRSKAIEKGLIDLKKEYTDDEITALIFLPGFSTQDIVNNISGRGVGMDVVETEIKKLGGKIDVVNKKDIGCIFILKIPMNLVVMNGTIVEVFDNNYIIPTLYIKEFVKPTKEHWISIREKCSMVKIRNEIIPLIPIFDILEIKNKNEMDSDMLVILEVDQKLKALPVKSIIGRQEVVTKPLSSDLRGIDYSSGASILGDGKVSLILDIEALFKKEGKKE